MHAKINSMKIYFAALKNNSTVDGVTAHFDDKARLLIMMSITHLHVHTPMAINFPLVTYT